MKSLLLLLVTASFAFAEHPDSLRLSRYGEPTFPMTKKVFRHIRLAEKVNDTGSFVWNAFGKVAETEDGATMFGYQMQWNRATATYYFTINDTVMKYYTSIRETEDSDAVFQIQTPLKAASAWQYRLTDSAMITLTADNETVTVPAGTFDHCMVTVVKEGDDTITRTFAPDIGMIKMTTIGADYSKLVDLVSMKK